MAATERLFWITLAAITFIVGGEIADARKARKYEGINPVSLPFKPADLPCTKQAIREHINACATRARMEKVTAP